MELKGGAYKVLDPFNQAVANPFNGIERLGSHKPPGGECSFEESIQWNWKEVQDSQVHPADQAGIHSMELKDSKALPDKERRARIHSMELKEGGSKAASLRSASWNPFNGIER